MPDYLIQPSADADDDLTNAIVIDDAADPLTNQGAVALGLTLGTNYKIRTLGAPATLNVAALPSSLSFADAIAGGDSAFASVSARYGRSTGTLFGTTFITEDLSERFDSSFSASMPAPTKAALIAAGDFVAICDVAPDLTAADFAIEANGISSLPNSAQVKLNVQTDPDDISGNVGSILGDGVDVSAQYGQAANSGAVYRVYLVWTQPDITRIEIQFARFGSPTQQDDFRNCTVFQRTQFDADDAIMKTEIAALDPRL